MAQIKLQVAGVGYDGAPAGQNGDTFEGSEHGSERDKVFYKISSGGGIRGAVKELLFEAIQTAYLNSDARSSLQSQGIIFQDENSVRAAGMSQYVLWQAPDNANVSR
jgi:hypothetical protein